MIDYVTFYIIVAALAIHFIADFIFQSDKMAKGKSKDNRVLFEHCWLYSIIVSTMGFVFIYPISFYGVFENYKFGSFIPTLFLVYLTGTHFGTDWITSRISSKLYSQGKIHLFFVVIGLDQLIHFITLFGFIYYVQLFLKV
jgi:hypothetical protein